MRNEFRKVPLINGITYKDIEDFKNLYKEYSNLPYDEDLRKFEVVQSNELRMAINTNNFIDNIINTKGKVPIFKRTYNSLVNFGIKCEHKFEILDKFITKDVMLK